MIIFWTLGVIVLILKVSLIQRYNQEQNSTLQSWTKFNVTIMNKIFEIPFFLDKSLSKRSKTEFYNIPTRTINRQLHITSDHEHLKIQQTKLTGQLKSWETRLTCWYSRYILSQELKLPQYGNSFISIRAITGMSFKKVQQYNKKA